MGDTVLMEPGRPARTQRHDQWKRFADALRALRADQRVTTSEVAAKLGVSQQSVSAWEAARSEPERETVWAIERVFRLAPGTLSRILGFLPVDDVGLPGVVEAVTNDPVLLPDQKAGLLATYRAMINSVDSPGLR